VDNDALAQRIIRDNLFQTGLARQARCLALNLPKELERITGTYDIIFADPPYHAEFYAALIEGIAARKLLKREGALIIEHSKKDILPDSHPPFERTRHKHYGDACLSLYRYC
jgi:16S rRNA (guanine966-N2)-methyltransferase